MNGHDAFKFYCLPITLHYICQRVKYGAPGAVVEISVKCDRASISLVGCVLFSAASGHSRHKTVRKLAFPSSPSSRAFASIIMSFRNDQVPCPKCYLASKKDSTPRVKNIWRSSCSNPYDVITYNHHIIITIKAIFFTRSA